MSDASLTNGGLLAGARAGTSGVLVLRGEAGSGKTALLQYVPQHAPGCRIASSATREPSDAARLTGLPELAIHGLDNTDARGLLKTAIHGPLDPAILDCLIAETRGNPLALLQLPRSLAPTQLAGGFGLADSTPLAGHIEEGFIRRLESLPSESRTLLLPAAADPAR